VLILYERLSFFDYPFHCHGYVHHEKSPWLLEEEEWFVRAASPHLRNVGIDATNNDFQPRGLFRREMRVATVWSQVVLIITVLKLSAALLLGPLVDMLPFFF
jgi:hypothetical protein